MITKEPNLFWVDTSTFTKPAKRMLADTLGKKYSLRTFFGSDMVRVIPNPGDLAKYKTDKKSKPLPLKMLSNTIKELETVPGSLDDIEGELIERLKDIKAEFEKLL